MIAMQYQVKLPADYDMDIIKNRVRDNSYKTDGYPDLEMKAYLIAEKGACGNMQNEYAPFYLWRGTDGMNTFLLDGPFEGVLRSFGWTAVTCWNALYQIVGRREEEQYAAVDTRPISPRDSFEGLREEEEAMYRQAVADKTTGAYVAAYNPVSWQICRFLLSTDADRVKEHAGDGLVYRLHHLS